MNEEPHVCMYCGAPATHQFKNGKWCCNKNIQLCPSLLKKHSEKAVLNHQRCEEIYGKKCFNGHILFPKTKEDAAIEHFCSYCGNHAEHKLKNGKWCCCKSYNSCPALRKKNSQGLIKKHKEETWYKDPNHTAWNKGLTAENNEIVAQYTNTRLQRVSSGEIIIKGHPQTEEVKQKLRALRLKEIEDRGIVIYTPNFSVKACSYMDKLNESKGWHLQHGLNGGEVRVDSYFLDGYDKELNIAFEYDEPGHYNDVQRNILNESDIFRMRHIHQKLGCRFFRYNEKIDNFYEVQF